MLLLLVIPGHSWALLACSQMLPGVPGSWVICALQCSRTSVSAAVAAGCSRCKAANQEIPGTDPPEHQPKAVAAGSLLWCSNTIGGQTEPGAKYAPPPIHPYSVPQFGAQTPLLAEQNTKNTRENSMSCLDPMKMQKRFWRNSNIH